MLFQVLVFLYRSLGLIVNIILILTNDTCFLQANNGNSTASSLVNSDDIWQPRMREVMG